MLENRKTFSICNTTILESNLSCEVNLRVKNRDLNKTFVCVLEAVSEHKVRPGATKLKFEYK